MMRLLPFLLLLVSAHAFSSICRTFVRPIRHVGYLTRNQSPNGGSGGAYLSSLSSNADGEGVNSASDDAKPALGSRITGLFKRDKNKKVDLAKMGTNFVLAYLFISNVMGWAAFCCAWFLASRRSGLSPLAPGQWKVFSAIYAGFFVFLNIIRPTRIAFAFAFGKYWGKLIAYLQDRFSIKRKAVAVAMVVFGVNVLGTCVLFASGIGLASLLAGVPVWATK